MSIKANPSLVLFLPILLLLLSLALPSLGYGVTPRDPKCPRQELERCKQQCQREESGDRELRRCEKRCEEDVRRRRESEDPHEEYVRCQQDCDSQEWRERRQCRRMCKQQYEERQKEHEERGGRGTNRGREVEKMRDNPYYFHAQRLQSKHKTREGHISVLEKFSDRSEILRGIENYRLSTLEANPNTFVVPHHCDAESIVVVLRGRGTITCVLREEKWSNNLEKGDVLRIPAGATVYLINRDNNEKLNMVKLMQPVNSPGNFREYFAAGGENPESFYRVFSNDVLEAALNTPRDELDRLFGQQRQGAIIKASREHLQALSRHLSSSKQQKGDESTRPFNLLNQQPLYSNRYGNLIEASPNDYQQLKNMDISVSYTEIKRGSLMVPHYNSEATTIILIVEGTGRIEMASPPLECGRMERIEREEEEEEDEEVVRERSQRQYRKISSNVSPGDVFVAPAGHPIATLASENQNLITVAFQINARNNQRNFLAGGDNIMNQIEREAKELSFNSPAENIERIFRNQRESHFVAGPREQSRRGGDSGRDRSLPSILEFPVFF